MCFVNNVYQQLANQAMAVVISSPDRQKLNRRVNNGNVAGPPSNSAHVREWLLEELEIMFMDNGMLPVSGGWECNHGSRCPSGYLPQNNQHTTSVLFIPNTQVCTY